MSVFGVDYGTISGGGGNVKSDTLPDTTATSQQITIDTGLSEVKRFVLIARVIYSGWTPRYRQVLAYDVDADSANYYSGVIYNTGASGKVVAVGTQATVQSFRLVSITGGTVIVESPTTNNNYALCDNIHWYAE